MTVLVWLVPLALAMGLVALTAFLWSLRSHQYDDLDGAAERILLHPQDDRPLPDRPRAGRADGDAGRPPGPRTPGEPATGGR